MLFKSEAFNDAFRVATARIHLIDAIDIDSWNVDGLRVKSPWLNYLLYLSNDSFGCPCHVCIKVASSHMEFEVALCVCSLGLYQRKVSSDRVLLNVLAALEHFDRLRLRHFFWLEALICFLILDHEATSLNDSVDARSSIKCRDATPSASEFLRQSTLGTNLQSQFSVKILNLTRNVVTEMRKD